MSSTISYTKFLRSAVAQRKRLLSSGKNRKDPKYMENVIMHCEDLLMRAPSDQTVMSFIRKYKQHIKALIPARTAEDERLLLIDRL